MTRFIKVSGTDKSIVLNIDHIVIMVPVDHKSLMTSIATSNPNEDCWCRETISDIVTAMQSQPASESGVDVIDVAEWAKYHSK